MSHSYVDTKRIAPIWVNNVNISFCYSRALERVERNIIGFVSGEREKVLFLWLALEYLGDVETGRQKDRIREIIYKLSPKAQEQLAKSFNRKLFWAKYLIDKKEIT